MRRTIYWLFPAILLVFTTGLLLNKFTRSSPLNPVAIIGLDGADWNIINRLLAKEKLPHLRQLIQEGTSGVLHTVHPTNSPVIWTSIATGKNMLKHGILDWTYVTKNNIEVPYTVGERRAKPFWNILSENKISVGIINWWYTFPSEEVNGYVVSDRMTIGVFKYLPEEEITYPPSLKDALFPKIVQIKDRQYVRITREEGIKDYLNESKAMNMVLSKEAETELERFRIYTLQDKSIENISLHLLENISPDLFVTYFRLIDIMSHSAHAFLKEEMKRRWEEENEKRGGPSDETQKLLYEDMATIVESVYSYLDNVVGRIVKRTPVDSTFLLISDHGFNFSTKGYGHYDQPVLPHGIILMKGPGIKAGHKIEKAHIYDITPTLLYLFNLPVGKDMNGKVLLNAFQDEFQKKRKVQTIATYETGLPIRKTKRSEELDKKVLEDLKSLGYIK